MKLEGLVHATVCFPVDTSGRVLMGRKTRVIGVGLFNAPGGGVEEGETIDEATAREVREEIGIVIDPTKLQRRAIVRCNNFKKDGVTPFVCKLYVSVAQIWRGTARQSNELVDLVWFLPHQLPLAQMMAGDRDWVPQVLEGKTLSAEAWYAPGMKRLAKPTRIEPRTQEELDRSWTIP